MSLLTPELRAWLTPGLAGVVATIDAEGQPEIVRLWALRARPDEDTLEIYVQRAVAEKCLQNLARGGQVAVNVIEVTTYRSRTFKGFCTLSTAPIDAEFLAASLAADSRAFLSVGMPAGAIETMLAHGDDPRMVALTLKVDSVFDQSPKPGAGAPL